MSLHPVAWEKKNTKNAIGSNRTNLSTNPKRQLIHRKGHLYVFTNGRVSWLLQNHQSPAQT